MTHRRRRVFEASRSHARRRSVHPKAYSFRAAQACAMVSRRSLSAARPKRIALGTHAVQHRHAQRGYEGAVASAAARARYRPARRSAVVHCPRRAKNFSRGIEGELETKRKGGFNDVFSPRVCPRALGTHAVQHRHAQRGHEGAVASAAASARPKRVALACGTGLREGQPPFTVRGRARSA